MSIERDELPAPDDAAIRGAEAILGRESDASSAPASPSPPEASPSGCLDSDPVIASHLACGEHVLVVRADTIFDRRQPDSRETSGLRGRLYLTSSRLVLLGETTVAIPLDDIEETTLWGEQLLVSLPGGRCLTLHVDHPQALRTEIGAARACARERRPPVRSVPGSD